MTATGSPIAIDLLRAVGRQVVACQAQVPQLLYQVDVGAALVLAEISGSHKFLCLCFLHITRSQIMEAESNISSQAIDCWDIASYFVQSCSESLRNSWQP